MTIRAEHIGSLQRPEALLAEVHRIYEAGHTSLLADERAKDLTQLRALEDEAIRGVVARQEDVGLEVVTDGEFRRLMYFNSFFDAVDGLSPSQGKLQFRGDDGSVVEHEGAATITGRVAKIDSPAAREAAFVRELTERTVKVSFPTASFLVGNAALGPGLAAYDSPEQATESLVGVLRSLVDDAVEAGATYVQFDVSGYMMLSGSPLGELARSRGIDLDALLDRMLEADRAVVAGLPAHVTTCLHQCRGNYASRYLAPHDHLGELGETFFSLPYDRFTLEWDGHLERTEADYAALARVPRGGATVVLGVVSTRHDRVESADEILATVERAAKHIPVEQLAISPQCGFASALTTGDDDRPDGNPIDEDAQWRKLELLATTARRIWT
jgi:5-methyltetrahydropteroyltriglutamate--homocysteine methyltransferase